MSLRLASHDRHQHLISTANQTTLLTIPSENIINPFLTVMHHCCRKKLNIRVEKVFRQNALKRTKSEGHGTVDATLEKITLRCGPSFCLRTISFSPPPCLYSYQHIIWNSPDLTRNALPYLQNANIRVDEVRLFIRSRPNRPAFSIFYVSANGRIVTPKHKRFIRASANCLTVSLTNNKYEMTSVRLSLQVSTFSPVFFLFLKRAYWRKMS